MRWNFFSNLSLKNKLYSIAILTGLFLLIIGGLALIFRSQLIESAGLTTKVQALQSETEKMFISHKNFIISETRNPTFFESGESRYLRQYNEHHQIATNLLNELEVSSEIDQLVFEQYITTIRRQLTFYDENVARMAELLSEQGTNIHGFSENMQTAARTFYENRVLQNSENVQLKQALSELKALEKKYFTGKGVAYHTELLKALTSAEQRISKDQLTDTAQQNYMSNAEALQLIENLAYYKTLADKIVATNTATGATLNEGIFSETEKNIVALHNATAGLLNHVIDSKNQNFQRYFFSIVLIAIALLLAVAFIVLRVGNIILRPFKQVQHYIAMLGEGQLPERFEIDVKDERSEMVAAINNLTDNLRATKEFVTEVGRGNLESEVNVFGNKGELGGSLLQMREELIKIAKEREKQEKEDRKRNWITQGLAKFSDILRSSDDNISELGYRVVSQLVEYIEANQGMLYIINDNQTDDVHLELIATHAYSRRKFMEKRIELGEGLTGQCALEKKTVYMTDLPEGHFAISTGLGESEPKSVLIVPLNLNNETFGVVEVASFKKIQPHQIEFVEKIAENVASSISSVRISNRTAQLLQESKLQAEELASKEEEMRQNMEELQATQEEAARKEAIATGFVNSVNHTIIRADFKLDGTLEYANTKFLDLMGYRSKEVKGQHYSAFIDEKNLEDFNQQWERVISGGKHIEEEMRHKTKRGYRWILATFTSIRDSEGNVIKVLYLAIDIHKQKAKNLDFEGELKAINRSIIKSEYHPDGTIIEVNKNFLNNLGYPTAELRDKTVFSFIHPDHIEKFQTLWASIADGVPFEDEIKMISRDNSERWYQGSYTAVKDFDEEVYKVVYIAYDITSQKRMQIQSEKQAAMLIEQQQAQENTLAEMRQVQKEMADKDAIMSGQLNAINKTNALTEYSLEGEVLKANDIFCELFGYVESDIKGRNHRMFISPEERKSEDYIRFWNDLQQGKSREGEFKRITKNGSTIFIKGIYNPMFDSEGKPYKILELAFDITESKLQQAEIRGQLEAINRTNGMVEIQLDGAILHANEIIYQLFGYKNDELTGRNYRTFLDEEYKNSDNFREMWTNLIHGHYQEGEVRRIKSDGSDVFLKEILYPILDASGKPYKILMLAFDITKMKKQQQELAKQVEVNQKNLNRLEKNDVILRKSIEEAQQKEMEVRKKNEEVEKANKKMKASETILKKALEEAKEREAEIKNQREELQASEEELRQNMEELQATQEAMAEKQLQLEKANKRMKANENILKKALQEAKEREAEVRNQREELQASEEELRQNMEELQTTQEAMEQKQLQLEKSNKKMKASENILKKALQEAKEREAEIKNQREELQASEEELRQNMEELQATQEAMAEKQLQLEKANKRMKANENILKKVIADAKEKEQELIANEEELRQNLEEIQTTQEAMEKKQKELTKANKKYKASEAILRKAMNDAKKGAIRLKEKEEEFLKQLSEKDKEIENLKKQLKQK